MSTKLDRNFIKSSMTSCDESSIKFASLESVEVKKTRNRIRPIENKESAKVRSQAQGKYSKAKRACIAYMESTVVDISIPPPSFKPVPLSLSRSPLL